MPTKTAEKPKMERTLRPAPMPMMSAFVKLAVGTTVKGTITQASYELEKQKNKKGRMIEKDRYHFSMLLADDVQLIVGNKKTAKNADFKAGQTVSLPEHGFLISAMRRTACELAGVPYNDEADTDLGTLVGVYFEITRQEDKEISKGEFAGTASAIYDVQYDAQK